jgi:hypothetical protein
MKQVRYALSVAFWTCRHLSLARGRWVADYCKHEGT